MILKLIKNNTLIVDDFVFKCAIGKNGSKYNKIEGDHYTPKGEYNFGGLFWRSDRVKKTKYKIKDYKNKEKYGLVQ